MESLKERVVVVTGAGRPHGIGRATALRFAREGAHLVLADLPPEAPQTADDITGPVPDLDAVASEVRQIGAQVLAVATNVRVQEEVVNLLSITMDRFRQVDVMVCNAAILPDRDVPLQELTAAVFQRVIEVNLMGTFFCAQEAAKFMGGGSRGGSIITIGSGASRIGNPDLIAYSASKFGIVGLTQSMALALAPQGIRVNCVCPGAVDTDLSTIWTNAKRLGISVDEARARSAGRIPLGRMTTPDDVANLIAWLASSESGHITGQAINVNGGAIMN